ncbi:hypothetical protein POVCU2_0026170 [Plasmodium ovale curtisi]|uniref:Uncharacterized protein n=1 Tax=Plasmodium ovale curtisi TaxID=864141 RepID=A0A1A8VV65_PLAOA|nr:hypothetical protein POVCU2_0026170 [Plasmodium ovale curtisi]
MGFFVLSSSPTPNNVPCPYGGTENEERENMGRGIYLFDLIRSAIFYVYCPSLLSVPTILAAALALEYL